MADRGSGLLTVLLREVSRSFYLTLRVLPVSIRTQISLAYLLARTSDTIADTRILPVEQRRQALESLRDRVRGISATPLDLGEFASYQGMPAERSLLENIEQTVSLLDGLSPDDRQRVREVMETITSGQELDLNRFGNAGRESIASLNTDEELADYTYRVAGCVGEFWTRLCRAHVFPQANVDESFLLAHGVRFGQGLQLVNILRDLAADLRQGRCYLPYDRLWAAGLSPADLLDPAAIHKLRPLYQGYLEQAEEHLAAGWQYTIALPRSAARVRLACAWPILIGLETIQKLRVGNVLAPELRIKLGRAEVRRIIARTVLWYPWPMAWQRLFTRTRSGWK